MLYAKCKNKCEMEDNLIDKYICCYWCDKKGSCDNPCRNLDCKAVKMIEVEDS